MTIFIDMTVMNLVTPKAAAKRELLFNKPAVIVAASGLLNILVGLIVAQQNSNFVHTS